MQFKISKTIINFSYDWEKANNDTRILFIHDLERDNLSLTSYLDYVLGVISNIEEIEKKNFSSFKMVIESDGKFDGITLVDGSQPMLYKLTKNESRQEVLEYLRASA